ncbi:MAG: hypothetical protein KME31_27455 [Tolypothrix carrinoi HA7290-LM1]|jgi:hypothetical protein|nr:hypothetical protein [Tolypothrix carrinoi HA7290-LM1]
MAQSARLSAIAFTVALTGLHYGYDWVPTMPLYPEQLKLLRVFEDVFFALDCSNQIISSIKMSHLITVAVRHRLLGETSLMVFFV